MRKQYIAGIALWLISGVLVAQNETDAFRYAQYSPTGTARYTSLGGAMGGFGADFTVLSANNPAGIGLYKRSEFTLTPALQYTNITSTYNESSRKYSKPYFNLNNIGFVLSLPLNSNNKWKSFQLATGYNNLARYSSYTYVKGPNHIANTNASSYFDVVASSLSGVNYNNINDRDHFLGYYGWENTYLLDTIPGTNDQYFAKNDYFEQKQTRSAKGYLNEYVFSGGANYDDKLFLGVTLGIPFFRYDQTTTYTESANFHYDSLTRYDEFSARETGINLKLGLLYQPFDFLRFGVAFHTPTLYNSVRETYTSRVDIQNFYVTDTNIYNLNIDDGIGKYEYQLVTPYHVIGNLAFLFKRYGFVNIDYEFVDYSTSNFPAQDYDFDGENNNIKQYYKGTHNVRAGVEINLTPVAFRLGYSYTSNPYKGIDKDGTTHIIAAGIGFKTRYFFMDFAYRYRILKDKDMFYDASNLNPYSTKLVNQLFALTLGCKLSK
jgi:hypothetical protein